MIHYLNDLQCTRCGSTDLELKNNYVVCNHCKNKYKITNDNFLDAMNRNSQKDYTFSNLNVNLFASKINTPFFLFSSPQIKRRFEIISTQFNRVQSEVYLYYSLKTNFNNFILKIIREYTRFASASSVLELESALDADFRGKNISYDGPGLNRSEALHFLDKGVRLFNLDSIEDAVVLNRAAEEKGVVAEISPRINFGFGSLFFRFNQVFNERFGFSEKAFRVFLNKLPRFKNIHLVGVGFHIGSQVSSKKKYLNAVNKTLKMIQGAGLEISHLNIGGGFPAKNLERKNPFTFAFQLIKPKKLENNNPETCFLNELAGGISELLRGSRFENLKLLLQPGRFIVGDAGIIVSKITSVKDHWIFLDSSVNYLPESFLTMNRSIVNISKLSGKKEHKYSIAGRTLCADIFNINLKMPRADVGDLVVIESAGAYSLSRANNFTTLTPPVYMIENKNSSPHLIKDKEKVHDVIKRF